MYSCKLCNYVTKNKNNYTRHSETEKHIINMETKIEKKLYDELNETCKKLEETNKTLTKEIEKLKNQVEIYKEICIKTSNKIKYNNIITNNINYVINNYGNAPPLEKMSNFTIGNINMDDKTQREVFVKEIIYYYKNNSLHKYLGDHIVKTYKKTDPKEQSFHTTDASRCNYIVKLKNTPLTDDDTEITSSWKKDSILFI